MNQECSMSQASELDTAPETIEATLNYIRNNGEKIFTETASPGGLDVRSGGTPDPHQVTIRNGRDKDFVFDRTLRTADDELREATKIREVVRRVHNDYTEWSAPQRVRDILPAEADD